MSKDLFSGHASQYAAFRPTYPKELYDFIMGHVKGKDTAWDCATGNGQVAKDLSHHFKKVFATDLSPNQVANAAKRDNIFYSVASAEQSGFADNQFDLITVGQAIHWFNLPEFFNEARRVSKPGGIVAVWGYGVLSISKEIDPIINEFYCNKIGPYWDKERKMIDDQYGNVSFPFDKIEFPRVAFSFNWTLDELAGYLSTWSSVQKYLKQHGSNPVGELITAIAPHWGAKEMKVSFPLFGMIGRVEK